MILDISQVSKESGLPASTVRYYEEMGLIESVGRRGLKRIFSPDIILRLSLIILGRKSGFTLDEIKHMLMTDGTNIDRQKLVNKADELDKQIKRLTSMRDGLRHAANCDAPSHLECPKFLKTLHLVTRSQRISSHAKSK